jgi:hypothetical protein
LSGSLRAQFTERVSIDSNGVQSTGHSTSPRVLIGGRYVLFDSQGSNLVSGDTNAAWDVFLRDRSLATSERLSVATGGAQGNGDSGETFQSYGGISASSNGTWVAFVSAASSLVPGDTNGYWDVFVRDRALNTTERVSVATGGAILSASGAAYVTHDTLVFTTSAEKPTATSILMQGSVPVGGVDFGQGLRFPECRGCPCRSGRRNACRRARVARDQNAESRPVTAAKLPSHIEPAVFLNCACKKRLRAATPGPNSGSVIVESSTPEAGIVPTMATNSGCGFFVISTPFNSGSSRKPVCLDIRR